MGKYDNYSYSKDDCFLRLHYYLALWRIYYAALKRLKIYDSTAADSNDDEDEMDDLSESPSSETKKIS